MKRANLFSLAPTQKQHSVLQELAVSCAKLWNQVNYLHRQQYQNYLKLDWNPQAYKKYVPRASLYHWLERRGYRSPTILGQVSRTADHTGG